MAKKKEKKKSLKKKDIKKQTKKKKILKKKDSRKKEEKIKKNKKKKLKKKDITGKKGKKTKEKKKLQDISIHESINPFPQETAFLDHSSNYNVRDALAILRALTSQVDVLSFTKGENRITITKVIPSVTRRLEN